jgi:hypothetical protein
MSERETDRIFSRETCEDPHEESLRTLFATAYPPLKLTPSLRQQVADEIDRRNSPVARPARCKRPLFFQWGMAAAAGVAVLLAVLLGLAIVRPGQHRSPGQQAPSMAQETQPERVPRAAGIGPQRPLGGHGQAMARLHLPSFGGGRGEVEHPPSPSAPGPAKRNERDPLSVPVIRPRASTAGDLDDVSDHPEAVRRQVAMPRDEWDRIEAGLCRAVPVRDDFVRIPFPRIATTSDRQIAEAVESYKREAAVVDPRLSRAVTLQQKATALSDLCERLRADTGIQLAAGSSVADEKVTVFCEKQPLRDVMRQLSRPFGYTWERTTRSGEYRYELVQDLRSQLLEEELRNRDRNAALLALEREIDRYCPYLDLSPEEALARAKTAPPAEKKLLESLAGSGWGPIHVYFRLSRPELEALRAGESLSFGAAPKQGQRPLPPEIARGVLQSLRNWRALETEEGLVSATADLTDARAVPLTASPAIHAQVRLAMPQLEPGHYALEGLSGFRAFPQEGCDLMLSNTGSATLAAGQSPGVGEAAPGTFRSRREPGPASAARGTQRPSRITLRPQPSCRPESSPAGGEDVAPKATTADVLEALHRVAHRPIVADYYTRLYDPGAVSVRDLPFSEALDQLCEQMRLRWNVSDGEWLQFRSAAYFHDRLKEVPSHLLARWADARRKQRVLTLDDLVEISGLSDAQLEGQEMAEGARRCWGLAEWDLARDGTLRPHLRFLAGFTPEQRQEALGPAGLLFAKMPLAQQQRFLAEALYSGGEPIRSLEDLAGATLRVVYTQPGGFEWRLPLQQALQQWVIPVGSGRRALRPLIWEKTHAAALARLQQLDLQIREGALQLMGRFDPQAAVSPPSEDAQIVPTKLDLIFVYVPSLSNRFRVREVRPSSNLFHTLP